MIWIILSILGLGIVAYKMKVNKKDTGRNFDLDGNIGFMLSAVCVFIIIAVIQFGVGLHTYMSLAKDRVAISVLEKRVENIKTAYYHYESDGAFVTGSIENMNQSTNLSKFISDLAWKESEYSKDLKNAKLNKEIFPLLLLSYGWAVPNEIYELEAIK